LATEKPTHVLGTELVHLTVAVLQATKMKAHEADEKYRKSFDMKTRKSKPYWDI
jgi:hypothetical protein